MLLIKKEIWKIKQISPDLKVRSKATDHLYFSWNGWGTSRWTSRQVVTPVRSFPTSRKIDIAHDSLGTHDWFVFTFRLHVRWNFAYVKHARFGSYITFTLDLHVMLSSTRTSSAKLHIRTSHIIFKSTDKSSAILTKRLWHQIYEIIYDMIFILE